MMVSEVGIKTVAHEKVSVAFVQVDETVVFRPLVYDNGQSMPVLVLCLPDSNGVDYEKGICCSRSSCTSIAEAGGWRDNSKLGLEGAGLRGSCRE